MTPTEMITIPGTPIPMNLNTPLPGQSEFRSKSAAGPLRNPLPPWSICRFTGFKERISPDAATRPIKQSRHGPFDSLSIITVLIAGVLEWNRKARSALTVTAAARERATLTYMATAGIHAAMALLIKDKMDSEADPCRKTGPILKKLMRPWLKSL
jgi:hypothetical protein